MHPACTPPAPACTPPATACTPPSPSTLTSLALSPAHRLSPSGRAFLCLSVCLSVSHPSHPSHLSSPPWAAVSRARAHALRRLRPAGPASLHGPGDDSRPSGDRAAQDLQQDPGHRPGDPRARAGPAAQPARHERGLQHPHHQRPQLCPTHGCGARPPLCAAPLLHTLPCATLRHGALVHAHTPLPPPPPRSWPPRWPPFSTRRAGCTTCPQRRPSSRPSRSSSANSVSTSTPTTSSTGSSRTCCALRSTRCASSRRRTWCVQPTHRTRHMAHRTRHTPSHPHTRRERAHSRARAHARRAREHTHAAREHTRRMHADADADTPQRARPCAGAERPRQARLRDHARPQGARGVDARPGRVHAGHRGGATS